MSTHAGLNMPQMYAQPNPTLCRTGCGLWNIWKSAFRAAMLVVLLFVAGLVCTPQAMAQMRWDINPDTSISMGIGLRASYISQENAAPNGSSRSNSFQAENISPYFVGEYKKTFKIFLHFDRQGPPGAAGSENIRMLDGVGEIDFRDEFNIWVGRMLPPTDRGNLYGRFYASTWFPPSIAGNYPQVFGGRDDGAMVWGNVFEGKLGYSVGAYNGHNRAAGLSNAGNSLLYAGRLQWNFWDAEPGYYRPSSYLGHKSIFTVGLAGQRQSNGVGTAAAPGTLSVWSADVLIEKKLAGGYVPSFEGIYYKYNLGGVVDCGSGEPGSAGCASTNNNVGGQVAGHAYSATALLLFPQKVGWGQFQPWVRYQRYDRDVSQTSNRGTDIGLNYIIDGFNLRISAIYSKLKDTRNLLAAPPANPDTNQFLLGIQYQY